MNELMNELTSNVDESSQNMLNQKQEETSLVVFQVFYQHFFKGKYYLLYNFNPRTALSNGALELLCA